MQKGDYIRGIVAEPTDDIREKPIYYHEGVITGEHQDTFDVTQVHPVYDFNGFPTDRDYDTREVFREGAEHVAPLPYKQEFVKEVQEQLKGTS